MVLETWTLRKRLKVWRHDEVAPVISLGARDCCHKAETGELKSPRGAFNTRQFSSRD